MKASLSIDLESYWHAEQLRPYVDRSLADERILPAALPLLDLLGDRGVHATFFVVGELIAEYPALIRRIHAEGHEIACHGFTHRPLWELTETTLHADLSLFAAALKRCLPDVQSIGFRAPDFSLTATTAWSLAALARHGYLYDSSVSPALKLPRGPSLPSVPYRPAPNLVEPDSAAPIWEWPVPAWRWGPVSLPVCSGWLLRVFPPSLLLRVLTSMANQAPLLLHVHSWEFDPFLPRLPLSRWQRLRCYQNTGQPLLQRLEALLDRFEFAPMAELLQLEPREAQTLVWDELVQ